MTINWLTVTLITCLFLPIILLGFILGAVYIALYSGYVWAWGLLGWMIPGDDEEDYVDEEAEDEQTRK